MAWISGHSPPRLPLYGGRGYMTKLGNLVYAKISITTTLSVRRFKVDSLFGISK